MKPGTRSLTLVVLAVASVCLLVARSWRIDQPYSIDFQTYWLAGSRVAAGEAEDLYRPGGGPAEGIPLELPANEFKNLPIVSALFVPFARTDYLTAKRIFWWVGLGALAAAAWWTPRRRKDWIACLALFAVMDPAHVSLRHGQTTPLVLAALGGYLAARRSRRDTLAGVLLGTACLVKFPPLALLAAETVRGRRRVATGAGLTMAAGVVASIAGFGLPLHEDYLRGITEHMGTVMTGHNNQSLLAVATRFSEASPTLDWTPRPAPGVARWFALVLASVMAGTLVWAVRRRSDRATGAFFTASMALGLVALPVAWDHYFLLLGPGVFLLAAELPVGSRLRSLPWTLPFVGGVLAITVPTPHRWIEAADRLGRISAPGLSVECAGALALFGVSVAVLARAGEE